MSDDIKILLLKALGGFAYILIEYWIGKTDKTKANSVLEFVIDLLSKLKK